MSCIDFPCVNYSRLIAFGKKRENKTHGKISHSTVNDSQLLLVGFVMSTNIVHFK